MIGSKMRLRYWALALAAIMAMGQGATHGREPPCAAVADLRVVDESGQPIPGVAIWPSESSNIYQILRTSEDGRIPDVELQFVGRRLMGHAPAVWYVYKPGYVRAIVQGGTQASAPLVLRESGELETLEIRFVDRTGSPVAGLKLAVFWNAGELVGGGRHFTAYFGQPSSDAQGRVLLPLDTGFRSQMDIDFSGSGYRLIDAPLDRLQFDAPKKGARKTMRVQSVSSVKLAFPDERRGCIITYVPKIGPGGEADQDVRRAYLYCRSGRDLGNEVRDESG